MTDADAETLAWFQSRLTEKERTIAKLERINQVLMDQVERRLDASAGAFSLFQTAAILEDQVLERTKALDEALSEADRARRRLQEAVEAIGDGFALWDADDRLVMCNARYHDFWQGLGALVQPGVAYETLLREVARLELVDWGERRAEQWIADCLVAHTNPAGPHTHQMKDGRIVQVTNTGTADGGIVTVFSDVSALLEVEEARRVREVAEGAALLASTVTNIAQGVAVFDAAGLLLTWNRRACELLNLPYYAIHRGMNVREGFRLMARHRARFGRGEGAGLLAWIDRRRARAPIQIDIHYPGNTVVEAAFRSMPDQGFVVTFYDKTEERQAKRALESHREELAGQVRARTRELVEVNLQLQRQVRQRREAAEALEQARADAVAANQSKTRFLAAASHDLLQPLSAARLYLSALEAERDEFSPAAREGLAALGGAMQSVEDMLGALLEISKLDVGAIEPEIKDFPLQPLLAGLAQSLAGHAAEKGLRLDVVATDVWVRSDPALLRRILQNLMTNAVKYTGRGRVLVGVRRDGADARIEVWDTGPGIPEAEQEAIFEEFRRGLSETNGADAAKGAGLGLAIVRRAANLLDHRVSLRSIPGRGTRFRVHVRRAAAQSTAGAVAPQVRRVSSYGDRLVLLLENDPEIADGMRMLFQRWRCPLLAAASYEALVDRLEDEEAEPDLLIADLHLDTAIDGLAAIDLLRQDYPGLPAALVTADRSAETAERATELGVELFLKPIRPAELRAFLDHCFSEH